MTKNLLIFILTWFTLLPLAAQRNTISNPNIRTLVVMAGSRWYDMPIIYLNGDEVISIGFDELSHVRHRYIYKVEHCDFDWTPSEELFESDFIDGFADGNLIDNTQESLNTNVLYTHYAFNLPNSQCKLKMSGNYKVTVYDGNQNNQVACVAYFMVAEKSMGISLSATTNTDADINGRHQQLSMEVDYANVRVTDHDRQVKTVVLQNGRWDNAIINPKPQYVMAQGMRWEHNRDLIFNGGNEYRKFELLDMDHTTMGLEKIDWDGTQYQVYPWTAEPRPNYVFDEDANGAFLIRNSDNVEIDNTCDYGNVHFRLKTKRQSGDIYLNGQWTNDLFLPEYKMDWNDKEGIYECVIPLKQGYYNYQFLRLDDDGTTHLIDSEGNFYQTENDYEALVYYRGNGERTDRLVGYNKLIINAKSD